jgi:DeoR/GlpR family transcriptional regulator of sugar metabolism
MASLFNQILSGVMLGGASVLSVTQPQIGLPMVSTARQYAASSFGSSVDGVTASGQAVATGTTQAIIQANIQNNAQTADLLAKQSAYNSYLNQGYTETQAAQMSGISATVSGTGNNILKYGLLAVGAYLVLKLLKIIR